jgi:hypothetical protein
LDVTVAAAFSVRCNKGHISPRGKRSRSGLCSSIPSYYFVKVSPESLVILKKMADEGLEGDDADIYIYRLPRPLSSYPDRLKGILNNYVSSLRAQSPPLKLLTRDSVS